MFPLRPGAIVDAPDLRHSGYAHYSTYGHFGDGGAWEREFKYTRELLKAVNQIADAAEDTADW